MSTTCVSCDPHCLTGCTRRCARSRALMHALPTRSSSISKYLSILSQRGVLFRISSKNKASIGQISQPYSNRPAHNVVRFSCQPRQDIFPFPAYYLPASFHAMCTILECMKFQMAIKFEMQPKFVYILVSQTKFKDSVEASEISCSRCNLFCVLVGESAVLASGGCVPHELATNLPFSAQL
eukprot:4887405-Pleurochrysis_carterae.AAC.2